MKHWKLKVQGSRFKVGGWRPEQGFTLIEVILVLVLIGIMAALAANIIANSLDRGRFDETWKEMNSIKMAIVGNPDLTNAGVRSDFAYVGDMGTIPTSITELLEQGAQPAWSVYDTDLGTGTGWRGPYLDNKRDDSGTYLATLDGWGNAYVYNSGAIAGTGQVMSYGSDGASGGSGYAADITVPETSLVTSQTQGGVAGRVTDIIGNPVRNTNVTITYPDPASKGNPTSSTVATDNGGNYVFNSIPIGKHRVQLTVGGTTYKKVAVILPSQTARLDFQVSSDPTIPSPVSSPAATGVAPTQINLTWIPPTTNTDGSTLIDLAGYNIYRSTTSGFTPGTSNLLASIGLAREYSDQTVSFGTTYYYHIRPVDKTGNINTSSTQVSAQGINGTGSIVQVTPANVSGGVNPTVSFYIRNTTGSNITVSSVRFYWSGNPPRSYDRVNFAGGGAEDNDTTSSGTCNNLDTTYTVAAGATVSLDIRFNGAVGTNQDIRINLHTTGGCGGTNVTNDLIVK